MFNVGDLVWGRTMGSSYHPCVVSQDPHFRFHTKIVKAEHQEKTILVKWFTDLRDQYFATRPRTRLLEKLTNIGVRDRDFWEINSGTRPGRDRESRAFSLETETRT